MSIESWLRRQEQMDRRPERRESDEWLDRAVADEVAAAERIGVLIGDGPLCSHCRADVHTDPACPVRKYQEDERREHNARWRRHDRGPRNRREKAK